ncbi:diacylglycerol/lipid kinase family protein [Halanaerobium salsuginis]|jgi:YegS/Rv2252/BmrU family lipid kinase|uniref:Lipid kinase, YegS/Rv2252/BmrU family n=1 Tax=Halanaerobium salsuginis TaxID=29563 RepID=A0A1I4JES1_9FIRM|nr:YegS/Rv2252/BmrU family lipid kinase [Halanaerobium salsuginis]SFL64713.1 lipid kinase, YegS/Rv2252/BmrU family [Halanaerobium salsuginis]
MIENKVKLIYNPEAGNKKFSNYLDLFRKKFREENYLVDAYRTMGTDDWEQAAANLSKENYQAVFIAGGDGSVNKILNVLMKKEIKLPLGIIPAGTANDFATYLGMSPDIEKCITQLLTQKIKTIDIGKVNESYFINACLGGSISALSSKINDKLKNSLGKTAYYLKGLSELPGLKTSKIRIKTSNNEITADLLAFFIFNSKGIGGFKNIAHKAEINDGLFDLVAIKQSNFLSISAAGIKLMQAKSADNDNLIYLQDELFEIESLGELNFNKADIDGEEGPTLPLKIEVIKSGLQVFTA